MIITEIITDPKSSAAVDAITANVGIAGGLTANVGNDITVVISTPTPTPKPPIRN